MFPAKFSGVGYRAKLVTLAHNLGLMGFVRNRPDGRALVISEDELVEIKSALRVRGIT